MTFLEKLKEDNPNLTEDEIMKRVLHSCPYVYGYGGETVNSKCMNVGSASSHCVECWNREMPNTEPKVEVIPQAEVDAWHNAHESGKAEGYEQGLNDAWELAKRVVRSPKFVENAQIFLNKNIVGIERESLLIQFFELTPQEALEKLKAYEEAQIEVGDVVKDSFGEEFIITGIENDTVRTLARNGSGSTCFRTKFTKTGKHIDIQSILEQIGE